MKEQAPLFLPLSPQIQQVFFSSRFTLFISASLLPAMTLQKCFNFGKASGGSSVVLSAVGRSFAWSAIYKKVLIKFFIRIFTQFFTLSFLHSVFRSVLHLALS